MVGPHTRVMLLTKRITEFSYSPSHGDTERGPIGVAHCNPCPSSIRVHVYGIQAAERVAESVNFIESIDFQFITPNNCNDQRFYVNILTGTICYF